MVEGERDGWILMAARWPEKIPELMADKTAQLEDPRTVQLYRLIDELVEVGLDEERLNAVADLIVEMLEESAERGDLEQQNEDMGDDAFVAPPRLVRLRRPSDGGAPPGAAGRTRLDGLEPHGAGDAAHLTSEPRGWTGQSRRGRNGPWTPGHSAKGSRFPLSGLAAWA